MVLESLDMKVEVRKPPISASSGALIRCGHEIVMYERDHKPNIPHPGKLGIIGGGVEIDPGTQKPETPLRALQREIEEEIGIKVAPNQIQYLGTLVAGDDQDHVKHISAVDITQEQKTNLKKGKEGRKILTFSADNLPREDELVPDLKVFFVDNRKALVDWLNGSRINAQDIGLNSSPLSDNIT